MIGTSSKNNRPRLLQVCAVDFTAYHFLLPLMEAQRAWGFDVELACSPGAYTEELKARGFPPIPLPIERSLNPFAHVQSYRKLKELIARGDYALVHVHTPVASLIGRPAARRCGVPLVVYTAHGFYFHDGMSAPYRRAHIALERFAQRYADCLMTQSEEDAATAVAERISPENRTFAIGNGTDLDKFRPSLLDESESMALRKEIGIAKEEGPIVSIIGRLVREKGYMDFAEAWGRVSQQFPEARVLIIGDTLESDRGGCATEFRQRLQDLGVQDSVIFAGLRSDVPALLAISDLFVLASWREGMPRSILEAMASGLPVIATNIRGCREEVVDGETGALVPRRDPSALAEQLTRLLGDAELRAKWGKAGRKRAEDRFDENLVIDRQEKIFRQLFEEKNLPWPDPIDSS